MLLKSRIRKKEFLNDEEKFNVNQRKILIKFPFFPLNPPLKANPISSFQISFFLSSYIIPLTLISILYVGMLIRLWHSVPGSKVSAESRRGKRRVTRMVVFVVLGNLDDLLSASGSLMETFFLF